MKHQKCRELLGDLSGFLDGEALDEICAEIRRQTADCPKCRIVVDTLRKTVTLYRKLPEPEMPDSARERLYKTLDLSDYFNPGKN